MSNIERLLDNAIRSVGQMETFEDFKDHWYNRVMLEEVKASPLEIWEMAIYVTTSYRSYITNQMDTIRRRNDNGNYT